MNGLAGSMRDQHRPIGQAQQHRLDNCRRFACCVLLLSSLAARAAAQEMQPRAYIPAPTGLNYFGMAYSDNRGGLLLDPGVPVEDGQVHSSQVSFSFGQTLGVAGRTAQVLAILPYIVANLDARASGAGYETRRSGTGDAVFRYAMNIYGAPAMDRKGFAGYRQGTIVGASITVSTPTGQYDPNLLINIGTNRWAFKPEIGVSRAIGKWTVEGAAGVWLYTANNQYYRNSVRTQVPLGSLQAHVVRLLPHRTWFAADWTLYTGGRSAINGRDLPNYQGNTRLGATLGISLRPRHAVKISYFRGAITRVGTDVSSIGISYNVIWQKGR